MGDISSPNMANVHTHLERHCQTFDDRVSFLVSKLAVVRMQARIAAFASVAGFIVFALHAVGVFRVAPILLFPEYCLFGVGLFAAIYLFQFASQLDFLYKSFARRKTMLETLAHDRVTKKNRILLYLRDFAGDVSDTASTSGALNAPVLILSSGALLKRWIHRLEPMISIIEFTNVRELNPQAGNLDWSFCLVGETDWRETVSTVLLLVDAVVFQVRRLSSGVLWEFEEANSHGLPALLLAEADQKTAIEGLFDRDSGHVTRAYYEPRLHSLDPRGLREPLVVEVVSEEGVQRREIGYGDFVRLIAEGTRSPSLNGAQIRNVDE